MVAVPEKPNPICIEEAKHLSQRCTNIEHLSIAELHRCHVFETVPDTFLSSCSNLSLSNSSALFFMGILNDESNIDSITKQTSFLVEIKKRCEEKPISEMTLPELKFCNDDLSLNLMNLFLDPPEDS